MHFTLSEDDQLIVASVAELCGKAIGDRAAEWDDAGRVPEAVLTDVANLGLLGMSTPEALGGVELSSVARAAVLEALGGGDAALALVVAGHDGLAAAHVARAATPVQRAAWLGAWAAGDPIVAWCAPGTELSGQMCDEGLRVSGQTPVTAGVGLAGRFVVNLPLDGGIASALVVGDQAGVSRTSVDRLGMRATAAGRVVFEDVLIPFEALIGTPGDGVVASLTTEFQISLGAIACGVGRAALAAARHYSMQREQFGQPISNFQAIQWKLANAATELDAAALLVSRAAWMLEQRQSFEAAAARAKFAASEAAERACSDALQIHGGYGYTREFPVERHLRAAKTLSMTAGTNRASRKTAAAAIARRFGGG